MNFALGKLLYIMDYQPLPSMWLNNPLYFKLISYQAGIWTALLPCFTQSETDVDEAAKYQRYSPPTGTEVGNDAERTNALSVKQSQD